MNGSADRFETPPGQMSTETRVGIENKIARLETELKHRATDVDLEKVRSEIAQVRTKLAMAGAGVALLLGLAMAALRFVV